MRKALQRFDSLILPLSLLIFSLQTFAQVSSVSNSEPRATPQVVVEAKVLGLPAAAFDQLGLVLPESASISDSPMGFAVVLLEGEAQTLLGDSRTVPVHSLKLQGSPEGILKFRVDSRVLAASGPSLTPPYFEVGMTFEVTPRVFPTRHVALASKSVIQVRRGPATDGALAPLVFETSPIKHDIQIPEGRTILLGGFLTASNSAGLPAIPAVAGNSILGYLASKSPRKGNDPEIIVLLTPRVIGSVEPVAAPMITSRSIPVEPILTPKTEMPAVAVPVSRPSLAVSAAIAPPSGPAVLAGPAATPATLPKVEARFFTVQVGAFGSADNADTLVLELKRKFEGVFIDKASAGPTPYRVRVGRLSNLAAARQIQTRLNAQGFDAFVVTPESR